jgi:lipopolysaccharide/colanic/teichoic acid biosynthesis glycosyltransferase/ADP-glucose pyrophosphorylase
MTAVLSGLQTIKAVILAGGQGTALAPLSKHRPVSLASVFNKPLIEHTINHFKKHGLSNVVIAGSQGNFSDAYRDFVENYEALFDVRYVEDDKPRGTAGILLDLKEHFDERPFVVVSGNCFTGDIDFDEVLNFHESRKAALTIVVKRIRRLPSESLICSADGMVQDFIRIHSSRERRSSIESVGIYVFSPRTLDYIDARSYFDIKEQLIPALRKASLPVFAYDAEKFCMSVYSVKDYVDLHRTLLNDAGRVSSLSSTMMIANGIWVGENVSISPRANLFGPIVIGSGSVIEGDAQIIGPAVIGERCVLEKGALARECMVGNDVVLEANARVQYCVVDHGIRFTSGELFSNTVVVDDAEAVDASLLAVEHAIAGVSAVNPSVLNSQKRPLFLFAKRGFDIIAAFLGLAFMSPVLFLIAVAIKWDSHGPVFFRQKRCGRGGHDFGMLKFRTMVIDAEQQQKKFESRKSTDGPMFKLENDPRITRVGRFLRKTSLDELPQLINVLRGEMSLVGPRPLVMNEMKCSPSWRTIRLRVKPGMTGLWQVSGRSEAQFHDWIRYDVHYVMSQCMRMDLRILMRTIRVVFKKVGAY